MSRFGGDSYAYFNQPVRGNTAAKPTWRQSHPNGPTEQELQALSASDLSVAAWQLNPPVFASAAADPSWRQSHPNGLTERELQALSATSLAVWQVPDGPGTMTNVAESPGKATFMTRLANFFHSGGDTQAGSNQ